MIMTMAMTTKMTMTMTMMIIIMITIIIIINKTVPGSSEIVQTVQYRPFCMTGLDLGKSS